MEWQYLYYAIMTTAFPRVEEPALVCRRWVDAQGVLHEEAFTDELAWEPSRELSDVEADGSAEIRPITEEAGLGFEAIQYARVHMFDPVDGKYEYFKLVELGRTVLAIRTWISPQGYNLEETHTSSGWRRSYVRSKLERDSMGGDLIPITQEEAEGL
ncbi:hypothetical protein DL991_07705 [Amycolatopsis sp. WAC 01375]|uniref:hypothetical protein n=1 Tax=unclassified Amycolatopsis TaxID=2618356 RepID=UPI000F7A2BD5|nr:MULTISPECIES: hypothetical protein [unclassified Amycolatopsis]RSM81409.1 hypothetical protein DL991_07705 [Amycolatopsis sp. WAC 01375]RSN31780.1 hypothetical protein DL990_17620 [Amycolatopsis sp. WAC 01416]